MQDNNQVKFLNGEKPRNNNQAIENAELFMESQLTQQRAASRSATCLLQTQLTPMTMN